MKAFKRLTIMLLAILSLSALCAGREYNVLLLIPAVGDKSYFDGAVSGLDLIRDTYGFVNTEVKAMGRDDTSVYGGFFTEACESKAYDLIITGGGECTDALLEAARAYPDQLFFDFDLQETYGTDLPNVYGVYYKSYDMGYLAGYLAAKITTSAMPGANSDRYIGAVLGIDFWDLNDNVGSFLQAAVDENVKAVIGYADSFTEPEKAYKVAKEMYDSGCDIIWGVAGIAGLGVFEAAADTGHYAFGVDIDQTLTVSDERQKATIVTSFSKQYAKVMLEAFTLLLEDRFPGGTTRELGLKEGGVGLVENEQYKAMVPEDIRASISEVYDKVQSGEIVPYSVRLDPDRWYPLKAQAEMIKQ